jgi:sugar/nucleoside kinase (ribokinase family)
LAALDPGTPIIDTVGAGDAFVGAFAARWASARVSGTPLDETVLRDMMRWGMAAGALACTRRGAIASLPSRGEVVGLLKR